MTAERPRAAVAVLVRGLGTNVPQVLLGRRRQDPRDPWSGHLALPGGRRSPLDRDLLDTAVRECAEEAGIECARSRAVCALPDIMAGRVTGANTLVRPWLICVDSDQDTAEGDGEMVEWEWFPLKSLDDESLRTWIEPVKGLEMPGVKRGEAILWGMTLRVLESLWTNPVVRGPRWWLDYDGTVYPASHVLTNAVDRRITDWVAAARALSFDEADQLRKRLYREHGNTLRGMMREDDMDPSAYLDFVFDLPDDHMPVPDPLLEVFLRELEPPASIFTNARADYVRRGLEAMGVAQHIGSIHDIESFVWRAKPEPSLYEEMLVREQVAAKDVAFVDDRVDNLAPARVLGVDTVLVDEGGHHAWLEVAGESVESAEESPYRAKIAIASDLLWLSRPRLGTDRFRRPLG